MRLARDHRYSLLVLLGVGLQFINAILNLNVFGVSALADVLFISNMIVAALALVSQFFLEQFWVFYAEIKQSGRDAALEFYGAALSVAMILQIVFVAVLQAGMPIVVGLFARNLDATRLSLIMPVMRLQAIGFLLYPLITINATVINAEDRIGVGYILQLLPLVVTTGAFGFFFAFHISSVLLLVGITVAGNVALAAIQAVIVGRIGVRFRPRLRNPHLGGYLKHSFTLRLGQNVNNVLQQPIITNSLSSFAAGFASAYTYARRFADIIYSVVVGPSFTLLRMNINDNYPLKKVSLIMQGFGRFYRNAVVVIPLIVATYFLLRPFLSIAGMGKIDLGMIGTIRQVFLLASIWLVLLIIEQPFYLLIISAKKSLFFLIENCIYICILFLSVHFLQPRIGIACIPVAMAIAQAGNNVMNISMGLATMRNLGTVDRK